MRAYESIGLEEGGSGACACLSQLNEPTQSARLTSAFGAVRPSGRRYIRTSGKHVVMFSSVQEFVDLVYNYTQLPVGLLIPSFCACSTPSPPVRWSHVPLLATSGRAHKSSVLLTLCTVLTFCIMLCACEYM